MIRALAKTLVVVSTFLALPAAAQSSFPDKPIHLIVPYAPGGGFDVHARVLANKMKDILRQAVVVENKPGAATTVGATLVAQSKPDGYTLLLSGANSMSYAQHQFKDLPYKNTDFQPITMVSFLNQAFMINTKVAPVKTLAEFVAFVKERPGKLSFGTSGTGGIQHMFGEQFKAVFGLDLTQVGYRGSNDLLQELLAGQLALAIDGYGTYSSHMQPKGPLLTLALNAKDRIEFAPDIPTFEELGYPDLTAITWGGIFAPIGTPMPVIEVLHRAIVEANNSPEIRARVIADGSRPATSSPAEFRALIDTETAKWKAMIEKLNFKPQG